MPALETAVEHRRIAAHDLGHLQQALADPGTAAVAAGGAQVDVGQLPVEKARHLAADRMRIPQKGEAMGLAQPRELPGKFPVIGLPVERDPLGDFGGVRRRTGQVDFLAVKGIHRAQPCGVLAGIKVLVVRRPVEIEHEA